VGNSLALIVSALRQVVCVRLQNARYLR